jgi:hypothetical protein
MTERVFTGKKLTRRQRQLQEEKDLTCDDVKVQFAWGRISGDLDCHGKGRKGLARYGIEPKTFIKTPEYLLIADRIYKKHAEFRKTRIFATDKKVALQFGSIFVGSSYISMEDF